ncbi:YcxB family protein [Amycolatopsis aidingensis]|uniref:YcxB family protein n=1 Tax=Amycolatopsis aidingensis TaxID=2842453 RepID=UPI001C0BC34A|nr:YcxB family protein [Amycolatopsis aidingensis]
MHIEIQSQFDAGEDLRDLRQAIRLGMRRQLWGLAAACLAFLGGGVLLLLNDLVISGILAFAAVLFLPVWVERRIRATIAELRKRLDRPGRVLVTDESYAYETDLEQAEYRWEQVKRVLVNQRFFLVEVTGQVALVIGRRHLTAAQDAELGAFLENLTPAR